MPRLKFRTPKYRRHKASGNAVVTFHGQDHYLGRYGSSESMESYKRLVAEWAAASQVPPTVKMKEKPGTDLRINELIASFLDYADKYYRKNGRPTGEALNIEHAVKQLTHLYGSTEAREFGPMALKTVRQAMMQEELCRKVINARINRIRRVFKWAVENQLLEASVLQGLQAVAALKKGRTEAPESDPVKPVPDAYVEAVLKRVTAPVAAMIEVQRLTGMRLRMSRE